MFSEFLIYFELGIHHILDWDGYDHILFVLALCSPYLAKQWRQVIILATAFTIGHSITLALYTLNLIDISARLVEILIPITILLTVVINLLEKEKSKYRTTLELLDGIRFWFDTWIGLCKFFQSNDGRRLRRYYISIVLSFNIGIEIGQIIIITILFIFQIVLFKKSKLSLLSWKYFINITIGLLTIKLLFDLLK